jgi:multicomponent Na+:H+ antiporter subunit F
MHPMVWARERVAHHPPRPNVIGVIRAGSTPSRILALDMLVLVLIAILVILSLRQDAPYLMDAALVLALVSFVATLVAARYHAAGRLFS